MDTCLRFSCLVFPTGETGRAEILVSLSIQLPLKQRSSERCFPTYGFIPTTPVHKYDRFTLKPKFPRGDCPRKFERLALFFSSIYHYNFPQFFPLFIIQNKKNRRKEFRVFKRLRDGRNFSKDIPSINVSISFILKYRSRRHAGFSESPITVIDRSSTLKTLFKPTSRRVCVYIFFHHM